MANPQVGRASSNNPPVPQLTEETVRELLSLQKQELTLRLKEIERDTAEIGWNRGIAQQSIEAQERDRKHDREETTKRQKTHQNYILLVLVLLLLFSAYAMYAGQAALVLDILKVFLGFLGGIGYQSYRNAKKQRQSDEE